MWIFGHCETPETIAMYRYSQNMTEVWPFFVHPFKYDIIKKKKHLMTSWFPSRACVLKLTPPACPIEWMAWPFFDFEAKTRACMFLLLLQPPHAFQWGRCDIFFFFCLCTVCYSANVWEKQCLYTANRLTYNFSFLSNFLGRKSTLSNPPPFPLNVRYYNYSSIC